MGPKAAKSALLGGVGGKERVFGQHTTHDTRHHTHMRHAHSPSRLEIGRGDPDVFIQITSMTPRVGHPKGKLTVIPYTSEVKDRYWTYGRSAAVAVGGLHKMLALDGRMYSKPAKDKEEDKYFSIYWAIQRTTEKKEANLVYHMAKVASSMSIELPCKRKYETETAAADFSIPVLTNPSKVPKHTRLVALDDANLHKEMKRIQAAKEKDKAKAK